MSEMSLVTLILSAVGLSCTIIGSLIALGTLVWRLSGTVSELKLTAKTLGDQVNSLDAMKNEVARIALLDQRASRLESDLSKTTAASQNYAVLESRVSRLEHDITDLRNKVSQ